MKHDYKAALNNIEEEKQIALSAGFPINDDPHIHTIIHALKLAHKVTQGPSDKMLVKAALAVGYDNVDMKLMRYGMAEADDVFKAAIAQAINEIEQGKQTK